MVISLGRGGGGIKPNVGAVERRRCHPSSGSVLIDVINRFMRAVNNVTLLCVAIREERVKECEREREANMRV